MPTVLQHLSDALADAGMIGPGQTPSSPMAQFALRKHAEMMNEWSGKRNRLFFIGTYTYNLAAGQGVYTIGPGAADFDTNTGNYVRPVFLQAASVKIGVARRWPLNILTGPQWEVNQDREKSDPDGPEDIYYDGNIPVATFNIAGRPTGPQPMYVRQWNPLRTFDVTELALNIEDFYPAEYIKPMRLGLSMELASSYQKPIKPETPVLFNEAITAIETKNAQLQSGSFGLSRTLEAPLKGDGQPVMQQQPQ